MEIIGLITEYNPFHKGHLYHINKIKEMYPDSLLILVLNGYFLQRGEISLISKENKTKLALKYGIDIVLELPFVYGTQAADIFAEGALKILHNFQVTKLIFGSESNDIKAIKNIVLNQLNDPNYDNKVKSYLEKGLNYPTALAKALKQKDFTFLPNDLLGLSYVKSIYKNNYAIEPIVIKRTSGYKDLTSQAEIISASNIRTKLKKNLSIAPYVPKDILKYLTKIDENLLFNLLKVKILTEPNLNIYLDVDEGIENRLKKVITKVDDYLALVEKIKTKRYTYNKINRMLIHILIGFKKEDRNLPLDYIRILGFNLKGQKYLNTLNNLNISPIIKKESPIYNYELKASLIYDILTNAHTSEFEEKKQPIIQY